MHPLTGSWTASLAKSRRDPNHQFHRATMRFQVDDDAGLLTFGGERGGTHRGRHPNDSSRRAEPSRRRRARVVTTSTIDERTLRVGATKDGAVVGRGSYAVSDNGQTLTATMSGFDASGNAFDQVIVFGRD